MNLNIRVFEDTLIEFCNGSQLPLEVVRLVLRDVLRLVEDKATATIQEELKEKNDGSNDSV